MKRTDFSKKLSQMIFVSVIFCAICFGSIAARAASFASIDTQPSDATVYAGSTVTLSVEASGSGTLTYQWYSNIKKNSTDGTKITGANSDSYSPQTTIARTTYYYCVVSLSDTEHTSVTSGVATVTVKALPKISTQPKPISTFVGNVVTLSLKASGSGTLSYQWFVNSKMSTIGANALDSETNSTYTAPSDTVGTKYYYCVVTNTDTSIAGSSTALVTSGIVRVSISNATYTPKISLQPSDATVYAGVSVKLKIEAAASGTLTYQWYSNTSKSLSGSSAITGAKGTTYSPPTANDGTYYYYCVVTDTLTMTSGTQTFSTTSDIICCQVNAGVDITSQPVSSAVYAGTQVQLAVTAAGNGTLKYQWYSNQEDSTDGGSALSGATTNRYTVPTANAGTVYYYCGITNTATANSSAVTVYTSVVSVKVAVLPVITTQPTAQNVSAGDTVTLTVAASGSGTLTYQWYINTKNNPTGGSRILGGTDASFSPSTKTAITSYYYCVVTNTDNTLTGMRTAVVYSNSVAVVVNATDASSPTIANNPSSLSVVVGDSVSLSVTASGSGTFSYQWYSNTKRSLTAATPVANETASTFSVPTDTLGTTYYYCMVTNTDNSMPGNKTASAASNFTAVTVLPLIPSITVQPTSSVVYCGSSAYLTVKASGSGILNYQWYSNTVSDNSSGTAISGAIESKCTVPTTSVGTTYYYCVLSNTLKKSGGTVTGTLASSVCSVTVAQGPLITDQPEGATINSGDGLTLSVTASGSGKLSYQWYKTTNDKNSGGTLISGATATEYNLSTVPATVTSTIYYYCVVTNTDSSIANGKSIIVASDTAKIIVKAINAAPPKVSSNSTTLTIKVGVSIDVSVEATASGTLSYQWYSNSKSSTIGARAIDGATNSTLTVTPASAGASYYYCVVTNTDSSLTGTKTASANSRIVKINATA